MEVASCMRSFLRILPEAFFGTEAINATRRILLYGATCENKMEQHQKITTPWMSYIHKYYSFAGRLSLASKTHQFCYEIHDFSLRQIASSFSLNVCHGKLSHFLIRESEIIHQTSAVPILTTTRGISFPNSNKSMEKRTYGITAASAISG